MIVSSPTEGVLIMEFKPFEDSETEFTVGGLTVSNSEKSVSIWGDFVVDKTKGSLDQLRALISVLNDVEAAILKIEQKDGLSDEIEASSMKKIEKIKNPFA